MAPRRTSTEKRDRIIARQRATIERLQATLDGVYLLADRMRAVLATHASTPSSAAPVSPEAATLPLILTLSELATIYRLSTSTIRRGLSKGTFHPAPFAKYPYRWRREDVLDDLTRRRELPRRPHGFARAPSRRGA